MRLILLLVTYDWGNQKPLISPSAKYLIFFYYLQTFPVFLTLPEDMAGYWNTFETHTDISKIHSQKIVTFVRTWIFQVFSINLEEWSLVCSFLWYIYIYIYIYIIFAFFVQTGNLYLFKNFRDCRKLYGIVKALKEKSCIISTLALKVVSLVYLPKFCCLSILRYQDSVLYWKKAI